MSLSVTKHLVTIIWATVAVAFLLLIVEPISIQAQFVVGTFVILSMILIKSFDLRGFWRHVFLALGTAVVLRYFYWRTTSTIPPSDDLLNFIPGVLLWLAEVYSAIMLAISLFVVSDPVTRPRAIQLDEEQMPTIDVLVPSYNEENEMLALTLAAAKQMIYPAHKLNVHLCDDGGTDQKCEQKDPVKAQAAKTRRAELQALCLELGCHYHTRAKNEHAKAGNMNSAIQTTTGQLIVVFDADHVPVEEFLQETVGYFTTDPRLFLVQSPHFFANPDPLEKNLQTFKVMPSENEMFYGIIQKGLDKWNAAFFCGSAAVLRREALDEVGGFSGISITEDCETALDLHSRGWNSLYVDKPMISGLQPDTLASFIGQRSRWCRGMFQIFLLKNPAFKKGLSIPQKISYLSNMTYWFFPISRLPFLISPLLYIWFSMQIYVANSNEFFAYTTIYMVVNMMMQNYLYGTVRWPWVSEVYEFVQSIFLSGGLLSVIKNPRAPTFNVTDKGEGSDKEYLSELSKPYFIVFGVIIVSTLMVIYRYFTEPDANELLIVVGVWNTFNLMLSAISLGVIAERRSFRQPITRPAELIIGASIVPVIVKDVSYGGVRVALSDTNIPAHLNKGTPAILKVPMRDTTKGDLTLPLVLNNKAKEGVGQSIGFEYGVLKGQHYPVILDMMFLEMQELSAFRESRRKHKGIFTGIKDMFSWGLHEPIRGFRYLYASYQVTRAAKQLALIKEQMALAAPEPVISTAQDVDQASATAAPNAAQSQASSQN